MSKTFNSVVFDTFSREKDVVVLRDFLTDESQVAYKRLLPKRTKDFPGMEKSEMKITLTDPTLGVLGIVTVSTSIRADQPDSLKSSLLSTSAAVQADSAYSDLVTNQKLPLNV